MAKVMISLPDKFLKKVDRTAQAQGRSRSELIREALRNFVGGKNSRAQSWKRALAPLRELEQHWVGQWDWPTSFAIIGIQDIAAKIVVDTSVLIKWIKTKDKELVNEARRPHRCSGGPPASVKSLTSPSTTPLSWHPL